METSSDSLQATQGLASLLEGRLMEWERARKPQELKMLDCYQDVMRIPRDNDTKGTGTAKSIKAAGLFIGSTRNKVRAARSKINDALFGNGKLPFDTNPTLEKLAPFADAMEDILTEQLTRGKFKDMLRAGVNTLATYGTGFMFGPFVRKETLKETNVDTSSGFSVLQETEYDYDFPYFELGNTLDVYPDPESREVDDGLGVFWVTMMSPTTVAAWRDDPRYSNIDAALQGSMDRGSETGSEIAGQLRGNVEYWHKNNRIKVARFFGTVPKNMMQADEGVESIGTPTANTVAANESDDDRGVVDVIVIMAGGVVVKIDLNPYGGRNPTHRCLYEASEHEMWGVGVAENNQPHQKTVNAAFRLFMEGKGMALLGTTSVDRSKFLPTEDFRKFPGKVYQFKPGLSSEERKDALVQHKEEDITNGWIEVIKMSEQFSDDDTGITKYTQGDDSRHLNQTASGISMIMSSASVPIKEVIQNIDSMWIEPIIDCLVDWNIKYLDVETVKRIHGDEIAQIWQQIKQFGKTSFMEWNATGTSSFMQKEVLSSKLHAFATFALGNPITAPKIDATELLQQTWDVMEIGRESPIKKDDQASQIPPEVQQQMQQMQEALQKSEQHMQALEGEIQKLQFDKQAQVTQGQVKIAEAQIHSEAEAGRAIADIEIAKVNAIDPDRLNTAEALLAQMMQQMSQFMGQQQPQAQQEPPPDQTQQQPQPQPADAGFFTPEQAPQ